MGERGRPKNVTTLLRIAARDLSHLKGSDRRNLEGLADQLEDAGLVTFDALRAWVDGAIQE